MYKDFKDILPNWVKEENYELYKMRHTAEHVLQKAIQEMYPEVKRAMGPAIEEGFYFDLDPQDAKISEEDLPKIEEKMKEIANRNLPMVRLDITPQEAKELFKNNHYKLEWIEEYSKDGNKLTVYWTGNPGDKDSDVDFCKGPHVENTKNIGFFKLLSIAGAYWRGDENNKMLTRIYGTTFKTQEELDKYLWVKEEAKKRDHRKLGKALDLFHIDDKVGLGLPLWHPKGAMLWRQIEDFWYNEHLKNGYDLVRSPHIGNRILWETSGHWGFYNSSMYPPLEAGQTLEDQQQNKKVENSEQYLLKPMNCPFHVEIYKSNPRSYKELPFRWAECGTVYRFEKKGELSGLTRVRGFTQDDAHIMCRKEQVEDELKKVIDFILFIYKSFGFDLNSVQVFLSLRDPKNKEKYAGNDEGWEFTENVLRNIAKEKNLNFTEELGEAAFYGPKLDFKIKDCIGRLWQCSTLQFDFNLPERFDMTFTNNEGKDERPYMLHRALFGSFERFIGLLIEHYSGAFPVWIAPDQVAIIPVSENTNGYADKIESELKALHVRAFADKRSESMQLKIKDAQAMKVPYMLIIGGREEEAQTVSLRYRNEKENVTMPLLEFVQKVTKNIAERALEITL